MSSKILSPRALAEPLVAYKSPVSIEMVVVFPAPLCPSKANICPLYIDTFEFSTATFSPKVFLKHFI